MVAVFYSQFIRRLAVRHGKSSGFAVGEIYCIGVDVPVGTGLFYFFDTDSVRAVATVCSVCSGTSDQRSQPFFKASFKAVFDGKFIRRLSVFARFTRCAGNARSSDQGFQPFVKGAFVAVFDGKLVRRFSVRALRSRLAYQRRQPLFQSALVAVLDGKFVCRLSVRHGEGRRTALGVIDGVCINITFGGCLFDFFDTVSAERVQPILNSADKPEPASDVVCAVALVAFVALIAR